MTLFQTKAGILIIPSESRNNQYSEPLTTYE